MAAIMMAVMVSVPAWVATTDETARPFRPNGSHHNHNHNHVDATTTMNQ